jgi:hypothetical protein
VTERVNPIATYSESCFPHKLTVILWPDRLQVFTAHHHERNIPLSQLSEMLLRTYRRSRLFYVGLFLMVFFGLAALLALEFAGAAGKALSFQLLMFAPFLAGGLLSLAFAGKIETMTFSTKQALPIVSLFAPARRNQKLIAFTREVIIAIRNQPKA